jgi:hypothetical protein
MEYSEFKGINEIIKERHRDALDENPFSYLELFCGAACFSVQHRATEQGWETDRYSHAAFRIWQLGADLLYALHSDISHLTPRKLHSFWHHHPIPSYLDVNNPKKDCDILKSELLSVAAEYLKDPDLQNPQFDYVLLDAIVYQDLHAFISTAVDQVLPQAKRFAVPFANGSELKFMLYAAGLSMLGFVFNWLLFPALAIYSLYKENLWASGILAALFVFSRISWLVTIPARRRVRAKVAALLDTLRGLYMSLDTQSLSPARFKQVLTDATDKGVVVDGAAFVIVDRMIERDPTMFAVPRT